MEKNQLEEVKFKIQLYSDNTYSLKIKIPLKTGTAGKLINYFSERYYKYNRKLGKEEIKKELEKGFNIIENAEKVNKNAEETIRKQFHKNFLKKIINSIEEKPRDKKIKLYDYKIKNAVLKIINSKYYLNLLLEGDYFEE